MKKQFRFSAMVLSMLIFSLLVMPVIPTAALETSLTDICKFYEFDDRSDYTLSEAAPATPSADEVLGTMSISGKMEKQTADSGITVYEVEEGAQFKLSYTLSDSPLLSAPDDEWHLSDDIKKIVNGVQLNDRIRTGAILVQTSPDGTNWSTAHTTTDLASLGEAWQYESNSIQLINGCYYRILVAYKTEKVEQTEALFIQIPIREYRKYAEVYTFYARYPESPEETPASGNHYTLGNVVNVGKNTGYSGNSPIVMGDPHYGWSLGDFSLSGYTEKTTTDNTFLKNDEGKLTLWFQLNQTITQLKGNSDLSIAADSAGYDQYFQIPQMDFGCGALIIRRTNFDGVKDSPTIYANFLASPCSAGVKTKVQLLDEGDYEVSLNYRIKNASALLDKYTDYKLSFNFQIRNNSCGFYPIDLANDEPITGSLAQHGFYLDTKNTHYLQTYFKRSVWKKGSDGYREIPQAREPAKEGAKYTEEGIYQFEIRNPITGESAEKKLYVGADLAIIASLYEANAGYTLDEISELLENGATLAEDGTLIIPEPETTTTEATTTIITTTTSTTTSVTHTTPAVETTNGTSGLAVFFFCFSLCVMMLICVAAKFT